MKASPAELMADEEFNLSGSHAEFRESPRFRFASAIIVENYWSNDSQVGRMKDYSSGGMCIETSKAPVIGTEILIGMDKSPYSSAHDVFRAKVVWVREIPASLSYYPYAVGVKYC